MDDDDNDDVLSAEQLVLLQQNKTRTAEPPNGFEPRKTLEWTGSGWEEAEVNPVYKWEE